LAHKVVSLWPLVLLYTITPSPASGLCCKYFLYFRATFLLDFAFEEKKKKKQNAFIVVAQQDTLLPCCH